MHYDNEKVRKLLSRNSITTTNSKLLALGPILSNSEKMIIRQCSRNVYKRMVNEIRWELHEFTAVMLISYRIAVFE